MNPTKNRLCLCLMMLVAGAAFSCSDDASSSSNNNGCGGLCTGDTVCHEGECIASSRVCGDIICPPTQYCLNDVCTDIALPDPCANKSCENGQICENGECIDPEPAGKCGDDVCEADETCLDDTCVESACVEDGHLKVCDDGLVCSKGNCIEPKCVGITCPDGRSCIAGDCIEDACIDDNGAEKQCGENQMCVGGDCVDDGCIVNGTPMQCADGWQCVKGECAEIACLGKSCPAGQTCQAGNCIDNECLEMTCDAGNTCVKGDCIPDACVGAEPCTQGKVCVADGSCQFPNAPALVANLPETLDTNENGASVSINLSLNNEPAADVTLECSISTDSPNPEAEVDCSGIVFNAENWDHLQTLTVVGLPDHIIDADQPFVLSVKTKSEDPEFDGLVLDDLAMTNINVDQALLVVDVPNRNLTTGEDGTKDMFTVVLPAKPASEVKITISTDNAAEGLIETPNGIAESIELVFTPDNWDQPQTVTVVGQNDNEEDGTKTYNISLESTSDYPEFNGLKESVVAYNIDDDVAGISVLAENIETDELGKYATIPVRLNSAPTSDVVITVTVSDGTEVVATTSSITFTKGNFDTVQEITITGLPDHIIDGDQNYTVTLTVTSEDDNYKSLYPDGFVVNGINRDSDTAGILSTLHAVPTVTEAGSSVVVDLVLSAIPDSEVAVAISVTDSTELAVSTNAVKFDKNNWNIPQSVTVSGVDDYLIDGDIGSQVKFKSTSDYAPFNGLEEAITFTTLDDDSASIIVNSTKASISENGGKTSFTAQLSAIPDKDVVIKFASSDPTELGVDTPETLTFNASNWNIPQTVNLKGIDDKLADGTQTAYISLSSESADPHFNGLNARTVDYEILDDETVSVVLALASSELKPGAQSTTLSVSLSTEPTSNVTVTLTTSNKTTAALGKTSFEFTPSNWNLTQTTTVTNTNPLAAVSAVTTEKFNGTATSTGAYNNAKSNEVSVKIYAFTQSSFAYKEAVDELTLLPGKYRLEAWGAQGKGGAWTDGVNYAGKGGYSNGTITLTAKTNIYVCVGGFTYAASTDEGGYNGGGLGHTRTGNTSNGGGATHIAKTTNRGTLKNYKDNQGEILIVAGGGGGLEWDGQGGAGGGENGLNGVNASHGSSDLKFVIGADGATQTAGGKSYGYPGQPATLFDGGFGYGGYGYKTDVVDYGAGGGGGWYGGGGTSYSGAAGGGSGHIGSGVTGSTVAGNTVFAAPAGGTETGHTGNGYAKITLIE